MFEFSICCFLISVSDDKSIEALSVGVMVTDKAIGIIPGSPSLDLQ
jgi:hypothetical protein